VRGLRSNVLSAWKRCAVPPAPIRPEKPLPGKPKSTSRSAASRSGISAHAASKVLAESDASEALRSVTKARQKLAFL
jgi:hypothetical protein